ncbi:MAG: ribosome biogenesis GTPase Der [Candidatus Solibacter usitatus]|nr:ribosome biogenesis GTPase Der [Candidatus Solibacter usitatus]
MPSTAGIPTVVIVGRPNVGKSTLFNAILGQRKAITGDEPGITRDRIIGEAVHRKRRFTLIDTGGIVPDDQAWIPAQILKQARVALDEAAHIIFLIDGRTEITSADRDLAKMLRRLGKPVTLAVNKIDVPKREILAAGFYELGFERVMPVSAEHRVGIHELLDEATRGFPAEDAPLLEPPAEQARPIRVAIIGRPNVGKSTLLNALVGGERSIVSSVAGTTRDSVDEALTVEGQHYLFVDTAGIRRKGKTHEMPEKLSVVMARKHIRMAHIALLVLDATEGPVGSDATIGGYAHEEGRSLIICVNKWDLLDDRKRKEYEDEIRDQFKFLDHAPIVFLSAKDNRGVRGVLRHIDKCWEAFNLRVPTGELNRFVETMALERDRRIFFMTQAGIRPPTFVLFMDRAEALHFSTERQIMNRIRKQFGFEGTPIVIKVKARRPPRGR